MDPVIDAELNALISQVIVALVGLAGTALLGLLSWATYELREWLKARKLDRLRKMFDEATARAKASLPPQLLEQGQEAVAGYLTRYAQDTMPTVLSKMGVNDSELARRMAAEAMAMLKVYLANSGLTGPQAANMATLGHTGRVGDSY